MDTTACFFPIILAYRLDVKRGDCRKTAKDKDSCKSQRTGASRGAATAQLTQ